MRRILFLLSSCLSTQLLTAQTNDTITYQLKAVNVVSSRIEKLQTETPRSITILTREDLDKAPYLTLGNLLEEQGGIYLVGTGQAPGSNQSIFVRGSNSNQTAIILDGVRIQDISTVNGVADLSELPLNEIERIEILRGSQSTLYGSPAIGGVIQITTRKPAKEGFSGDVTLRGGVFKAGGSDEGFAGRAAFQWKNGWYLQGQGEFFGSQGFNATQDTITDPQPGLEPDPDGWRKVNASVRTGYHSQQTEFSLLYRKVSSMTDIDQAAFNDDDNYTLDYNRDMISAVYKRSLTDRLTLNASAGWTQTSRLAVNDSSVASIDGSYDRTYSKDDYNGNQFSSDITSEYVSKYFKGVAGLSLLHESMQQENYYYSAAFDPYIYEYKFDLDTVNPEATTTAFFVHGELSGGRIAPSLERIRLSGGMRVIHHSLFGNKATFEVSPSYSISDNCLFFLSYSTGFNTPSLYQAFAPSRYYTFDNNTTTGLTLGNKDLSPEVSGSFEIGLKEISSTWSWSVSVFRNVTDNVIDYVYLWDGNIPVDSLGTDWSRDDYRGDRYLNTGTQVTYGAEITLSRTFEGMVRLNGTVSLIEGYFDYEKADPEQLPGGNYHVQLYSNGLFLDVPRRYEGLSRRPTTFQASLDFLALKNAVLSLQIRYTGKRLDVYYDDQLGPYGALNRKALDDYTLTDVSARWSLQKKLMLNMRIENIFDTSYQEIIGFNSRGRGIQAGITYVF